MLGFDRALQRTKAYSWGFAKAFVNKAKSQAITTVSMVALQQFLGYNATQAYLGLGNLICSGFRLHNQTDGWVDTIYEVNNAALGVLLFHSAIDQLEDLQGNRALSTIAMGTCYVVNGTLLILRDLKKHGVTKEDILQGDMPISEMIEAYKYCSKSKESRTAEKVVSLAFNLFTIYSGSNRIIQGMFELPNYELTQSTYIKKMITWAWPPTNEPVSDGDSVFSLILEQLNSDSEIKDRVLNIKDVKGDSLFGSVEEFIDYLSLRRLVPKLPYPTETGLCQGELDQTLDLTGFIDHLKDLVACYTSEQLDLIVSNTSDLALMDTSRCYHPDELTIAIRHHVLDYLRLGENKTAVVIQPKSDHNGAFHVPLPALKSIYQNHRHVYSAFVGTVEEVCGALSDAHRLFGQATSTFLLAGHGNPGRIVLGEQADRGFITLQTDFPSPCFEENLTPNATILLNSCSTGAPNPLGMNIATKISQLAPGRKVIAATQNTNNYNYQFTKDGDYEIYSTQTNKASSIHYITVNTTTLTTKFPSESHVFDFNELAFTSSTSFAEFVGKCTEQLGPFLNRLDFRKSEANESKKEFGESVEDKIDILTVYLKCRKKIIKKNWTDDFHQDQLRFANRFIMSILDQLAATQ